MGGEEAAKYGLIDSVLNARQKTDSEK